MNNLDFDTKIFDLTIIESMNKTYCLTKDTDMEFKQEVIEAILSKDLYLFIPDAIVAEKEGSLYIFNLMEYIKSIRSFIDNGFRLSNGSYFRDLKSSEKRLIEGVSFRTRVLFSLCC